jgi:hypothetical protein
MSTDFIPDRPIPMESLRQFNRDGVKTHEVHTDGTLILTDGTNYLHAYPPSKDCPQLFQRCGTNDPLKIIDALETAFAVTLVSEYDPEYDDLLGSEPDP